MSDALLALPFGLAIGVMLGLVGGGGSIVAVPILVYVLGEPVKRATTESLLIVGVTALVGALAAARAGRVYWRVGLAFAAAGAATSVAGTALNRLVSSNAILLAFAVLLVSASYGMLRRRPDRGSPAKSPKATTRLTHTHHMLLTQTCAWWLPESRVRTQGSKRRQLQPHTPRCDSPARSRLSTPGCRHLRCVRLAR
jgi:uncharacterized membrane protein YfcA